MPNQKQFLYDNIELELRYEDKPYGDIGGLEQALSEISIKYGLLKGDIVSLFADNKNNDQEILVSTSKKINTDDYWYDDGKAGIHLTFEYKKRQDENIVKKTCKDLNITYRELGEAIGYGGDSLRNTASKKDVSEQITKAINLYLETVELKKQLADCNILKSALRNLVLQGA